MTPSLKVVPAATLLAVVTVAVPASPVGAQVTVRREAWIPVSTNNVFWGLATGPVILDPVFPPPAYPAYGAAGRVPPGAPAPAPAYIPRILDCVHIPFPQCGGN